MNNKTILTGNWDAFNKAHIERVINTYGKMSPTYNPAAPPYAVFDWDNTSIFLDIEEAVLIYQLENLKFDVNPDQLDVMLHIGIDTTITLKDKNLAGVQLRIKQITTDIKTSYTWLYDNYKPFGKGMLSLDEVKKNPNYTNFITKVRFLYETIGNTFSAEVAYPWVTYLFAGLDSKQIREMTAQTIEWQKLQKIDTVTWTSPNVIELPKQLSGQVSVTWKNGLRTIPEMQELYSKLREAGFDVWVCSASFVDVVREIASNPEFGYDITPENVIAIELEREPNGKVIPSLSIVHELTYGTGKTKAINRLLAGATGKYGYAPTFIAGDSEGDQNMLTDFTWLKLGLIVNRNKGKDTILGNLSIRAVETYKNNNAKYLLQGRNDNTGEFIPRQEFIKLHSNEGVKLP